MKNRHTRIWVLFLIVMSAFHFETATAQANSARIQNQCISNSVGARIWFNDNSLAQSIRLGSNLLIDRYKERLHRLSFAETTMTPISGPGRTIQECSPERMEEMQLSEIWERCWGLPQLLHTGVQVEINNSRSFRRLAYPIPSEMKLSNVQIKRFNARTTRSGCRHARCETSFELLDFETKFDFFAKDLRTQQALVDIKKLQVWLAPNHKIQAKLIWEMKVNAAGTFDPTILAVQLSQLQPGQIGVSLEMTEQQRQQLEHRLVTEIYSSVAQNYGLPPIQRRGTRLTYAQMLQHVQEMNRRENFSADFEKQRRYDQLVSQALMRVTSDYFGTESSAFYFQLLRQAMQPEVQSLAQQFGVFQILTKKLEQILTKTMQDFLNENKSRLNQPLDVQTNFLRVQDILDLDKIRSYVSRLKQQNQARQFEQALTTTSELKTIFAHVALPELVNQISESIESLQQTQNQMDQENRTRFGNRYQSEIQIFQGQLETLRQRIHLTRLNFDFKMNSWGQHGTTSFAEVGICLNNVPAQRLTVHSQVPQFTEPQIGIEVSPETLNQLMQEEFQMAHRERARLGNAANQNYLDICLNTHNEQTCANRSLLAQTQMIRFSSPPKIGIDSQTNELYLEINQLTRDASFLSSDILGSLPLIGSKTVSGKIYFRVYTDAQRQTQFEVTRTQLGLTFNRTNPWSFLMSVVESFTFVFQNVIVQAIAEGQRNSISQYRVEGRIRSRVASIETLNGNLLFRVELTDRREPVTNLAN